MRAISGISLKFIYNSLNTGDRFWKYQSFFGTTLVPLFLSWCLNGLFIPVLLNILNSLWSCVVWLLLNWWPKGTVTGFIRSVTEVNSFIMWCIHRLHIKAFICNLSRTYTVNLSEIYLGCLGSVCLRAKICLKIKLPHKSESRRFLLLKHTFGHMTRFHRVYWSTVCKGETLTFVKKSPVRFAVQWCIDAAPLDSHAFLNNGANSRVSWRSPHVADLLSAPSPHSFSIHNFHVDQ